MMIVLISPGTLRTRIRSRARWRLEQSVLP
jgi:hypothetical protein